MSRRARRGAWGDVGSDLQFRAGRRRTRGHGGDFSPTESHQGLLANQLQPLSAQRTSTERNTANTHPRLDLRQRIIQQTFQPICEKGDEDGGV